ncbi:Hydroxymethylglutaryl-CoA lyase, mitochondrial [Tetrabaena socialis]|uniref:hydroxymethylglutaryl-CoA lyase n=1 Tax=Tetrabaena socialis TaxID=47790 RepID=A0A2J8A5Q2_9CHLO|nr:Hydroxymethylglutaryl-CoA lyase, mitochondrial [Tetrabaena socialis]|eukprot:PNH07854.1 Hydroxymethylglutaryl-CoA lyase, mitochondrial [Tetrabaena socialis]
MLPYLASRLRAGSAAASGPCDALLAALPRLLLLPRGAPQRGLPSSVTVYEVGPRDGLQNEAKVSMADTIGTGTPAAMEAMLQATLRHVPAAALAVHCHDTYGMAIANISSALRLGISVVDSSVAGLGGCPYARGATGNVATEDVMYLLDGYGIRHGLDWDAVLAASEYISGALGRPNGSRVARALLAKRADAASKAAAVVA